MVSLIIPSTTDPCSLKAYSCQGYILKNKNPEEINSNNNSAISYRLALLVEETEVPEENHRPLASH